MKKIGITGSLASGKSTASNFLSKNRGPLFSADKFVNKLYRTNLFKKKISKKLNIKNFKNIKKTILREKILENEGNIKKIEKVIHPIVRKEMFKFMKKHKKKNFIFFEIPLLIENKLEKNFDVIFFIKAKKNIRLKRFCLKGGSKKLFHILDKKQISDAKKKKNCDHVIVNEKNIKFLKKSLSDILIQYE